MSRESKKLKELKSWAKFVLQDYFDKSKYHVYKPDVFNNGLGNGYIGTCGIERNKYLFQGREYDTPEELCKAFKEYANTLDLPIALLDQSIRQSSRLQGIFEYYLIQMLGFKMEDSNVYYFSSSGQYYAKTIGETKLGVHILTDINSDKQEGYKVSLLYSYHDYIIQSDPIKDYHEGILFINAYILAIVGEIFSEFDSLSNKIMEIKGVMMPNAEGIDQSSSIFDVKKIDAKKMMKEQLLKILESFDD